jgi:flagellar biosynthetic protein FliR
MPASFHLSTEYIISFLLVLSRLAGLMIFLPVPGLRSVPETIRPLVALALSVPMVSRVPTMPMSAADSGVLVMWGISELALGLLWGLVVHFLVESFVLGAQFLALQAGFGYASIIDPSTQADAGLLQILAQLMASLLFFATGLHI